MATVKSAVETVLLVAVRGKDLKFVVERKNAENVEKHTRSTSYSEEKPS